MEKNCIEKIKIVFFGAGAFAPPVLEALLQDERVDVTGVYTQIDKAAGRKGLLTPTPLGQWCLEHNVDFERVPSVNEESFLEILREKKPLLAVIVSFGQILKTPILNLPQYGCLNVHSSLLPAYRGASPIVTALLNGEQQTGVTFMKMDEGLDTGPIYEQHTLAITQEHTGDQLERDLACLAGSHIAGCIEKICTGASTVTPQDGSKATLSKKIRKQHGVMDFQKDCATLDRMIRAFYPWPSVVFQCPGPKRTIAVKITKASPETFRAEEDPAALPGTILSISRDGIRVACSGGVLNLKQVIPEGKKEMRAYDFANGMRLTAGMVFLNGPAEHK